MGVIQLTVSIAAYNVEKYISRSVESCIISKDRQEHLEVIIVNDGSTDNTLNIALKYQEKYPDLIKVINKQNGGYGSTINSALAEANGKYFRLLDGDDWYDTGALEQFMDKLPDCDEDVIFTNLTMVNEAGVIVKQERYGNEHENKRYKISMNTSARWGMHKMAVKTELLVQNNVRISEKCFYTDMEYVFNIIKYMETYICFDISLYQYSVGRDGQSVSRNGLISHKEDARKVLMREACIFNIVPNEGKRALMLKLMSIHAMLVIDSYLLSGSGKRHKKELMELDNYIRKELPDVYELVNEKKIYKLMRVLNYKFYCVFRWNALRKRK